MAARAERGVTGQHRTDPALYGSGRVTRLWDREHGRYMVKILPGQVYVTRANECITTVLGSCIAACIRDGAAGIGGMNHFMLPYDGGAPGGDASDAARYGNYAMEILINEIMKGGGARERLELKIFGGGRVLQTMSDIGQRNIEFVMRYIAIERLKILAADVGDAYPRKVVYFPESGRVRVKKLRSPQARSVIVREEDYLHDLMARPLTGEVDLF